MATPPALRTRRTCATCGSEFLLLPHSVRERSGRFCSLACCHASRRGAANNRFNGGLCFDRNKNRWVIHCRDHTLLIFARGVMAAEVGRLLTPQELVHHVNGDSTDDRPENLRIVTRAEHIRIHQADLRDARSANFRKTQAAA